VDDVLDDGDDGFRPDNLAGDAISSEPPSVRAMRSSLARIVRASAAPYGYMLTIWSFTAVLVQFHGTPGAGDLLIFVAGAIAGFNLMGVVSLAVTANARPVACSRDRVLAGLLDPVAVGAVVGAVSAISVIHGWLPWLVGLLAATVLYLLIASVQLALLAARRTRIAARPRYQPSCAIQ
jgi:hypothetical protein